MNLEARFDVAFVAVHKWFARRPGSLFRSLVLAEFGDEPLRTC